MPEIKFNLNIEKDLENTWKTCNSSNKWHDYKDSVSKKIFDICNNKEYSDSKKELLKLNSKFYNSKLLKAEIIFLNNAWKKIGEEYFKRLEKITGKKFPYENVKAFITTIGRCPYNPDPKNPYFFVSIFAGIPKIMATAGHELLHLHFHVNYWPQIEREIGKEKTADLKEALTEILNLEFQDLWVQYDKGYECHKELREFIRNEWKKEKNFEVLIDKCVEFIKNFR